MKVFSLRNLVGLAALGGAYAYARKHGGVKHTFQQLMRKKDELLDKLDAKRSEIASRERSDDRHAQDYPPVENRPVGDSASVEPLFPNVPPYGQR